MQNLFNQKILAIDFGTKRVGLAISQGPLAVPFKVIINQDQTQVIQEIVDFCQNQQIDQVILGISEQEFAQKTRQFGQELKKQISAPLVYFDETLSSKEVEERFKLKAKPLPKEIDHYAAAYILEQYLDSLAE